MNCVIVDTRSAASRAVRAGRRRKRCGNPKNAWNVAPIRHRESRMSLLLLVGFLLVLWAVVVGLGAAVSKNAVVPQVIPSAQIFLRAAVEACAHGVWLHGSCLSAGPLVVRSHPHRGGI